MLDLCAFLFPMVARRIFYVLLAPDILMPISLLKYLIAAVCRLEITNSSVVYIHCVIVCYLDCICF